MGKQRPCLGDINTTQNSTLQSHTLHTDGINGGSHEGYVKWACIAAAQRGWRPVVLNLRGCNGLDVSSPRGCVPLNGFVCSRVCVVVVGGVNLRGYITALNSNFKTHPGTTRCRPTMCT